jgi:transposase-like protein
MRTRHSVEEKFEIVMESLTENTTQAEMCMSQRNIPNTVNEVKEAVHRER